MIAREPLQINAPGPLSAVQSSPRMSLRRAIVRARDCSRRQAAIRAWSPESSTSGTSAPRNDAGRVYAGASRRFPVNDSEASDSGRVEEGERRDLTAREHEVAERILFGAVERRQSLVDAFVVAADDDEALEAGESRGVGLPERVARGRGHDHGPPLAGRRCGEDPVEDPRERLEPQHHPRAAAEGAVVGALVLDEGVEQVM